MQTERNTHVEEDADYQFESFIPHAFVGEGSLKGPPPLIPSLVAKQLLEKNRTKFLTFTEHGQYVQLPPLNYRRSSDESIYSCYARDNTLENFPSYRPEVDRLEAYHPEGYNRYITIQDRKLDRTMHFLSRLHASKYLNSADTAQDKIKLRVDEKSDDERREIHHQVSVEAAVNNRENVDRACSSSVISSKYTYRDRCVRFVDNHVVYTDNKSNYSDQVENNDQVYQKKSNGNQEEGNRTKDIYLPNYDPEKKFLPERLDIEKINEVSTELNKHDRTQSTTDNYKKNDVNMKNDAKYFRFIDDNTSNQFDVNNAREKNENVTRRNSYEETIAKETSQNVKIDHLNMCNSETPRKKMKRGGIVGRRRKRGYIYDPKPIISKSTKSYDILPETTNIEYWAKRRRNNEAAKRSRGDRRKKELELIKTSNDLKIERDKLKDRVKELENWISKQNKTDSNVNSILP